MVHAVEIPVSRRCAPSSVKISPASRNRCSIESSGCARTIRNSASKARISRTGRTSSPSRLPTGPRGHGGVRTRDRDLFGGGDRGRLAGGFSAATRLDTSHTPSGRAALSPVTITAVLPVRTITSSTSRKVASGRTAGKPSGPSSCRRSRSRTRISASRFRFRFGPMKLAT